MGIFSPMKKQEQDDQIQQTQQPTQQTSSSSGGGFLSRASQKLQSASSEDVQQAFSQVTGGGNDGYQHSFNPNSAASWEAGIWDGYEGKERDDLYAGLDFAYNNAGSALYNPYRHATNSEYTDTLKKYGLDVPDIITADWIDEQWGLYGGYLKKDKDGSLGKARNKNEQIARALYGLEGIEYTTQKAEKELDDIRQTVNWYATHGYSQDYIAKVVGGMKHSTLDSIAITRDPKAIESTDDDGYTISTKRGTTVGLNRSVYFDDDILTGMYWKAINGVDDVSDFDAAVYAYQNKGRLRGGSKRLEDMRTYGNPNYNPHNDGCTNIEAKMAFGQDEFTYDDILRLRAETDENDTKRMSLIKKLFDNETRTADAEKELASIRTDMASLDYTLNIPSGYKSPKEYFTELADNWLSGDTYKTLATMDKRREEGNPMDINRSVNYRKEDIVAEMVARYNAAHGITNNPKEALAPAKPMSQEDALRIASGEITPDQIETKTPDIPEPPVKPAEEGNIDIDNRQVVQNDDGTFSTEESFSTNIDGLEVLLPTIIDGKRVSEDEAIAHYLETGENLGKFKTVEDAEAYAEWLHNRQEKVYGEKAEPEQPSEQSKERYNIEVGGHYVQVPVYDKDGNRMTEEEAMQAYIDSQNGSSSGGYTAPAPQTDTFRTYERRDDQEMQDWVDSHTTDSFDPNFVMKVPSSRGNWAGTVAAGGAVSDQPTWYKGKNDTRPQEVYVVTDKEGAQEFTSADLLHIMNAAYSGDGDQLTEEERRMGEGLINSIPWAFGDSLQWLGTNGEFDSGAMKRMDDTARALGEDLRNIRDAASSYYATSGEKADIAVRFFEDALSAANAGKTIAEWYDQTEEGQQRKQELLDEAAGINQRADDIKAENDEKERQAKREALAVNLTIMQASPDQLDENGKAAADQMALRPGEADSILAMPEAKETWDKEGRAFVDYVGANFSTPYQEALDNGDLATAQDIVRRFMGFPEGTNVDGISEDMFNAEQLGIIEVAKQLYAQDAKIAMASGMTLDEYYGVVGHRTAEDLMHASFQYRQLMNSEDSISKEAKQGIGVLATVWNGMKLGAVDVASSDVGFAADIANILTSPGDFESLSTRYTNRYGFFQGRSQYRNDVDTMLAWWESQDDEASQQKAAEYREKMKLIDANGLDIFNLGFNPDTDLLERVRKQVNDEINATQDWIDEYATDAEKHGVQIIRSATGSTIQQTRAMALSAVTGIPTGLATTMSFLPGSFEGHMQDTEGRGWSDTRRYMYAMIGGLMDAALEGEFSSKYYNMGGDALSGFLKDGATRFAATHGITGLGSHLVYGLMVYAGNSVGEITQEVLQNVAGGIYDYLWTGNAEMLRDSVARDTMVDTILSTALSTFMSTTAHQAGQAASGAPSIFSNRYRITTAAMLEFSPELREAAHEMFSAGSIYNRGNDVLDTVTEGSRQSATAQAEEPGEITPDRSMPEPTQANELNSARSVTEEEQAAPEQGPQIPAEAAETQTEQVEQPAAPVEKAPTEASTAEPKTEAPVAPAEEAPVEAPVEEAPAEAPVAEPQIEQLVDETQNTTEERTVPEQAPELPPQATKPERRTWYREARRELQNLKAAAERESTREVLPESLKYKSEDEIDDVRQGLTAEADTGRIVNAVSSRVKASVLDVYKKAYKQTGIRVGWCKDSIKEAKNLFSEYRERLSYRVGSKNLGDIAAQAKDYADRTGTGKAGESEQFQKLINASEGVDKAVALAEKWDKPLEDLSKKLDYFIGHELGKLDGTWFLQDVIPDLPKQLTEGLSTASPFTLRETADVLSSDDAYQFDLIAGISEACKKVYAQFDADVHSVASGFDEAVSEFTSALKHYTKAYIAEASGEKFSDAVIDHGYALPITEAVKLERERLERAETVLSHQADALAEMLNSAPEKLKQDLSNAVAPAYTNPQRLLIDPENETLSTLNRAIDNRREEINSRLYIERQEDEAARERESDAGSTSEQVSNLSPEMKLFMEKAGAWFRDAKTQLADLIDRAADQNITEEQKATLDHQIQTVQGRINNAALEIMGRLTKMDIHLKTAELMRNPEAVAEMVKFTASQRVASKIAAGALTAKPSTKEKLSTKLETAKAADAANKAAETTNANAQQAGADLTAARDANRENPTPENAKREVNAVKKKVDADRQAERARKEADDANTAAQKAEVDLNSELQSNLEAIRQEATDDATAEVQQLQQTVGDSLETALDEDSVTKVVLPPLDPEVTVNKPEAQTPVNSRVDTTTQDGQERLGELRSRLTKLNTDGKSRLNGNRYLIPAIVDAASADANIESYLTDLDDTGIQNLLRQSKAASVKKSNAAAWLRDLVQKDAANKGVTLETDSYAEAKEKLTSLKDAVMSMSANSSAPELNEPAKAVQTVLADQLSRLYAEKDKLEAARAAGEPTAEIQKNIRKIRREMAETMDFAGQVLMRYENSQGYSKVEPDKYTAQNNVIRDWLKRAAQDDKNGNTKAASTKLNFVTNREDSFDASANYIMQDINDLVSAGNRVTGKNAVQAYIAGPSRRGANVPGTQGIWPAGQRPTGIAKDGGTAENQPLRSTYQIGQKLASDLGIGLYDPTRRFYAGPGATGAYYPGNEHIEIRGHHANDERVIYHEIGHHIQNVTHMDTTQSMLDNADPVFLRQYAPNEQPGEAFAEFVRTYVNNREKACAIYGEDEVENFEREMRVAGIFGPIQEAALNQMRLNTATYREIGESHMKDVNNRSRPQSATREVSDAVRKFVIGMIDDTEAAARFDRRAGRQNNEHMLTLQDHLKLMKPAQKQATGMITDALVDMSGRRISEGFADTIAGTDENGKVYRMTEQDLKDLANLSLYMHAVDRMDRAEGDALTEKLNRAIETATQQRIQTDIAAEIARRTAGMSRAQADHFRLTPREIADITRTAELTPQELAEIRDRTRLTPEEARQARLTTQVYNEDGDTGLTRERLLSNIAEITERNPWAVDAHERMIGWWMDFTQVWGVNTGLITQKQYNDMWEKWPNYVPTYREGKGNELDFDSHTFDGSDGGFKLQRIVGSDRDVMNPLLGFSRNIGYYVEGARRNAALNHIYWEMQHNEEGFGDFCREVRQPGEHMLSFRDPDGTQRYLEFQDRELFEVIADNCRPAQAGQMASTIGKLTRSMAMFTTGSNPLFAMKNFVRDFQQGVNHGTWAYTYADGAVKWLRAAWEMHRNTNNAQAYKALAGEDGGRLSIPDNQKDADQLLRMFSEEYGRTGAVGRAKRAASRAWDIVTAKNFNEFIEQTTRYAEYRFGQHDLRFDVGRQKAYLAAQESTTNFALSGNSQTASVLRKVIPFFNATLQGTYSVIHAASPAERSKLVQRFTKTAVNNLLTGAFAYGFLQLFGSDEDKEWYEKLANGVKADYIILPLGGDKAREFLRIPLTQNPIGKLFYAAGQNIMSSTTADRLTLDIQATVSGILSDLIQTDVVFSPFLNAANNETYYGSAIVPNWMEKRSPTEHYNENTADIFIKMARFFEALPLTRGNETLTDPMKLQYITQQETGFIGKLLLPTLTGTRAASYRRDPVAWAQNMWNIMRNDWTSDAAYSNDINDAYHQADDVLNRVMSDLSGAGYTDLMARNSNPEFVQEAHNVAAYLTGSTGPFKRISEEINGLYDQQDAIYNNDKLSMDEKLTMARDIQKKIVNLEAEGVGIFKEYASTYLNQHYGLDYVLYGGAKGDKNRSSVYGFPILAKAENSGKYEGLNNIMSHYKEVKEQNKGKANSALNPCPSTTVDITDDYSVPMYAMEPDAAEEYQNVYLSTLERGMSEYNALWGSMDSKKKAAAISKVKREANKAAKAVVVQYYKVNGLIPDENKNTSGTLPDPRK